MDFKNQYFSQWGEVWNFHKKWCNNSGSELEWDAIVKEAGELMKQSEFLKDLTLAVIGELEKIDKEKRRGGVNND